MRPARHSIRFSRRIQLLRCLSIGALLGLIACAGGDNGVEDLPPAASLSAPSDLQAVVSDDDSIRLSWVDNSVGERGFEILQSDDGIHFDASYTVGGNATSYAVDGLAEQVDYSFRVRAFDDAGDSGFSDIVVISIGPLFQTHFTGTLTLHFSNDFPAIDESAAISAAVSEYGAVTFGSGTLSYDGEQTQGDFRIRRRGTLTIDPDGWYNDAGPEVYIEVDEHTTYQETLQTWYRDNSGQWVPVLDETVSGLWDGGLAFDFNAATMDGDTVSVVTGQGSAAWTLQLIAAIP